jgi:glycosyltransferase involved in cell wall biosynthesis
LGIRIARGFNGKRVGALREPGLGKQYGLKLGRRCEGIYGSLELAVEVYIRYSRPLIPVSEYRINSLRNHTTLREQWKFAGYLKRNRIQIVHSYGFYSNVFSVPPACLVRAPVVITSIRDTGDPLTPMQRRVQKAICGFSDHVLANSNAVRDRLVADGYNPDKIGVIQNGIVIPEPSDSSARGFFHREFGLPENARLIAVVSRLNPLKGIEYFLEAAAILAARFDDVYFPIVGDGIDPEYTAGLKDHAARLGLGRRVIFTGFRLDISAILPDLLISVLPSLSEGLSNVLLEPMAAGVPVVATNVGGNPEVVEEGVTGILVPPRDPAALADAVGTILENQGLAIRFGASGRRRVEVYFSLDRMVQDTQKLYFELLRNAQRAPRRADQRHGHEQS